jgi:hypothetical protein
MDVNVKRPTLPAVWPYLILCGVVALWISGSDFHRDNSSDSLVPVLTSLYRWTPFYWECNRIGMLVPLLALPFKNPMSNLLVQGWLVLFAAFATFFLAARWALRVPSWPLVGALAAVLFVVLSPVGLFFCVTFGQPHYCVGLALTLAALLLAEPTADGRVAWGRLPAALGFLLLAVWVNSTVPILFAPMVVLRALLRPRPDLSPTATPRARLLGWLARPLDREAVLSLALLVAAAAGGQAFRMMVRTCADPMDNGITSTDTWADAWAMLTYNTWLAAFAAHGTSLLAVAAAAGLLALVPAVRRRVGPPLRAAVVLLAGGLPYALAIGTLDWVARNGFCFKYWIPLIYFILISLAFVALGPLAGLLRPRLRQVLCVACMPALLLAVAGTTGGLPSRPRARHALDRMVGRVPVVQRTEEVLAARATHLVGSYGDVWVSVFHTNLVLFERGDGRVVYGVSGRSYPTMDLWGHMAPEDMRLACMTVNAGGAQDFSVPGFLAVHFPPMTLVEKLPTLWLYRPADEVPPEPGSGPEGALLTSWHSGFFPAEGVDRWCGRPTGKLTLTNTTDRPLEVKLHFQPLTGYEGYSHLWIDSDLYSDHLRINTLTQPQEKTFTVPPGKHVLRFTCNAPRTPDPHALRNKFFFLRNAAVSVDDRPAATPDTPREPFSDVWR